MRNKDQLALLRRYAKPRRPYRFALLLLACSLIVTLLPGLSVVSASPNQQGAGSTPPEPALDRAAIAEDTPVLIDVLANDLPANEPALVIVAVGAPRSGTAEITNKRILFQLKARLDFETQPTYLIDVQARSLALRGPTVTRRFVIRLTDANDAPHALRLSKDRIDEQRPVGSTVGTLSSEDADPATRTATRWSAAPAAPIMPGSASRAAC